MASPTSSHPDLISNLSDDLLSLIISFLPAKAAVATSALSRRWIHLWRSVNRLDFEPEWIRSWTQLWSSVDSTFDVEITHLLQFQIVRHVVSCQLHNISILRISHRAWAWRYLVQLTNELKHLQELAITCVNGNSLWRGLPQCVLPASLLALPTLRVLRVCNYRFCPLSLSFAVSLNTLELDSVVISSEIVIGIISKCELLENFSLCSCWELDSVDIRDHKCLKRLKLRNLKLRHMNICGKAVTQLVLDTVDISSTSIYINCPNLSVFRLFCGHLRNPQILAQCHMRSRGGNHEGEDLPLSNLRVLCTELDLSDDMSVILRTSVHLQHLDISIRAHPNSKEFKLPYDESMFGERTEVLETITSNLRKVWLRGFTGKEEETTIASCIIRNASMLEKIVIECDDNCSRNGVAIAESLISLPKASMDASVILKLPSNDPVENFIFNFKFRYRYQYRT